MTSNVLAAECEKRDQKARDTARCLRLRITLRPASRNRREQETVRLDPPDLPGNGASVANRVSTLSPDAPPERTGARRPGRVGRRNIARSRKSARLIRTFAGAIFHLSMRRQTID